MIQNQLRMKLKGVAVIGLLAFASACGGGAQNQNPVIDGVVGPNVNFVDNVLTMSLTIKSMSLDAGLRLPLGGKLPNSYIELGPDFQSNGTLVSIGIAAADLKAFVKVTTLDPTQLPGGRPLPGVLAGQLPALAVQVPQLKNVTFYIGPEVFGIFVPVKLGAQNSILTFRFYDPTNTQIGNISLVGQDSSGANDGLLMLMDLKGKVGHLVGL